MLVADVHKEEVPQFAQLSTSLIVHISDLGDDEVVSSLFQTFLVEYFKPAGEIKLPTYKKYRMEGTTYIEHAFQMYRVVNYISS